MHSKPSQFLRIPVWESGGLPERESPPCYSAGVQSATAMRGRKSTPRVRDGKVQRKNRTDLSPHYSLAEPGKPVIERHRPGIGYRHVLLKRDVEKFLKLLPDWRELSRGLQAVLLSEGERDILGWHFPGVVAICAWDRELASEWTPAFVEEHQAVLTALQVDTEKTSDSSTYVRWTEKSVKGFQLMHILLHELGHHHDRMTTRSRVRASRGETYAESYANKYAEEIWDGYYRTFG